MRPALPLALLPVFGCAPPTGQVALDTPDGPRTLSYEVVDGYAFAEGDILLGTIDDVEKAARASVELESQEWFGRVVPYDASALTAGNATKMSDAFAYWMTETPLHFVERSDEVDYVHYLNGVATADWCFAQIGRNGGMQLSGINNCSSEVMRHEIGHSVGMFHEHTRQDRDAHVEIHWACIDPLAGYWNFTKNSGEDIGDFDFDSIMLYGEGAFCDMVYKTPGATAQACDCPTMSAVDPANAGFGGATDLSIGDIAAIEEMYAHTRLDDLSLTSGEVHTYPFHLRASEAVDIAVDATTASASAGYAIRFFADDGTEVSSCTGSASSSWACDEQGRLGASVHPALVEVEATSGSFTYAIDWTATDAEGHNDAGASQAEAVSVSDGDTKTGSLRGEEDGHFYALSLADGDVLTIGAELDGGRSGAPFHVDVLADDGSTLSADMLSGVGDAAGSTHSGSYTHSGSTAVVTLQLAVTSPGENTELEHYALTFTVL